MDFRRGETLARCRGLPGAARSLVDLPGDPVPWSVPFQGILHGGDGGRDFLGKLKDAGEQRRVFAIETTLEVIHPLLIGGTVGDTQTMGRRTLRPVQRVVATGSRVEKTPPLPCPWANIWSLQPERTWWTGPTWNRHPPRG